MTRKLLLLAGLLGCAAAATAQKVTYQDSTVYRDGSPYCRMVRLNSSLSAPRFAIKNLQGNTFAQAQQKPGEGFVLYFTGLDTLVPIAPALPYAQSIAAMIVQHDLLANGALPDALAVRRLARLEARRPVAVRDVFDGIAKDIDGWIQGDKRPAPPVDGIVVSGNRVMRRGTVLAQYTIRRYSEGDESYKTIVITTPEGRQVAEADLPVSDARSCRLRLPEAHETVTLAVPYFPQTEQVKQIVQYLMEHAYLEPGKP